MVKEPGSPVWTTSIRRLNFGMMAYKVQKACVADGYWHHTLQFNLPPRVSNNDFNGTNGRRAVGRNCTGDCLRIEGLYNATMALRIGMRRSIREMVNRIYDLLPDLWADPHRGNRPTRGLLDVVGRASSFLFGTATESDVSDLRGEVRDLKAQLESAAADAFHLRQGLGSFDKLVNERLDGMHEMMRQESKSITMVFDSMKGLQKTVNLEMNAITHSILEIANFVELHDSVMQLDLGIEDLLHGLLTPKIVGVRQINRLLNRADQELYENGLRLCMRTAKAVYGSRNFDVARSDDTLFIRLRLPYTRLTDVVELNIFKATTFPLPVPGKQGLVTELQEFPKYIIFDRVGFERGSTHAIGELIRDPRGDIVDPADIIWHQRNNRSCVADLMADTLDATQEICRFSLRKEVIRPHYTQVMPGMYVLFNFTNIRVLCPRQETEQHPDCNPCEIQLPCGCSLKAAEGQFNSTGGCEGIQETGTIHPVNLAILQNFYDMTNVTALNGEAWPRQSEFGNIADLKLPLFAEKTDRLLAADTERSYSLHKLINNLQNESVVLHGPAEGLLYDYVRGQTARLSFSGWEWYDWQAWICVAVLPIGVMFGLCT